QGHDAGVQAGGTVQVDVGKGAGLKHPESPDQPAFGIVERLGMVSLGRDQDLLRRSEREQGCSQHAEDQDEQYGRYQHETVLAPGNAGTTHHEVVLSEVRTWAFDWELEY